MNQHYVKAASKWLFPFFLCLGIFFLIRGHNEPGGGFIGGLLFGSGFVIKYIGNPISPEKVLLWYWKPVQIISFGLLISLLSGSIGVLNGYSYMKGVWNFEVWLPLFGNTKFGTPFYFDIGVFHVVVGVVNQIFLYLEGQNWKSY